MFYPSIGTDDVGVSDGSGPKHGPWPGLKLGFFLETKHFKLNQGMSSTLKRA